MRLREIQKIIDDNVPIIRQMGFEEFKIANDRYVRVTNYTNFRKGLINLLETGLFEEEKELIDEKLFLPSSASDTNSYGYKSYESFIECANRILTKSDAMHTLITQNLHSTNEDDKSLVISLPEHEMSFYEFTDIIQNLKETFKLLAILDDFQNEPIVENFDVGSKWLIASFISSKAVGLFGRLVATIQRNRVANRQVNSIDNFLDSLSVTEEAKQKYIEVNTEIYHAFCRKLADDYLSSNDLPQQEEILSQMAKVTENLDKVLNMGVGFEAAVTASNEVAETFPSLESQRLLDQTKLLSSLKQLGHQSESSDEEAN
ncbi:hypothetical protein I6N96_03265 [Enterococcus sp. BWM-S5]|uniref:Uncharacterized protein n=1 Tax=Enterococcus larvae TaxID=2794352 RepID=A0ABS4CFS7_9ENTE|nr:hypothetical protein [Enterococcus larvae]MBP1045283.1 hypothetical protein [Enterococcus larvae]